jgi:hypothetical protein
LNFGRGGDGVRSGDFGGVGRRGGEGASVSALLRRGGGGAGGRPRFDAKSADPVGLCPPGGAGGGGGARTLGGVPFAGAAVARLAS